MRVLELRLKRGDKVLCIEAAYDLVFAEVYTVSYSGNGWAGLKESSDSGGPYLCSRFVKIPNTHSNKIKFLRAPIRHKVRNSLRCIKNDLRELFKPKNEIERFDRTDFLLKLVLFGVIGFLVGIFTGVI